MKNAKIDKVFEEIREIQKFLNHILMARRLIQASNILEPDVKYELIRTNMEFFDFLAKQSSEKIDELHENFKEATR